MDSNFDFLGVYDNTLSKEECDLIIDKFEKVSPLSGRKIFGSYGSLGDKRATTLFCDIGSDLFSDYSMPINDALTKGLPQYKKRYPFLEDIAPWIIHRYYNVQKYEEGQGYFTLHCEHQPSDPYRVLVWMLFLNDAESGTEFPYQNKTVDAKVGRLVLWPVGWSHPHKGVTPNKGLKYIATGWYCYEK